VREEQVSAMRFGLVGAALSVMLGVARADEPVPAVACLPPRELREVIYTEKLIPPAAAVNLARKEAPEAEIVRANLCRGQIGLVYVIVALRSDGRFVQLMIDAPSGKIVWSR
jgi:uncharacterized membrane protein YkoI